MATATPGAARRSRAKSDTATADATTTDAGTTATGAVGTKEAGKKAGRTKVAAKNTTSKKKAAAQKTAAQKAGAEKAGARSGARSASAADRAERRAAREAEMVQAAVDAAAGVAPISVLDESQTVAAAGRLARALATQPPRAIRANAALAQEWARVALGRSEVAPAKGDKRFDHPAWTKNPLYRRLGQGYLSWNRSVHDLIDNLNLDEKSRLRSQFVAGLVTEAVAPTNSLLGNPAAVREAVRTRGKSLRDGTRHYLHDLRKNGGMPSMVDTRPFVVGETVAATTGAVVYRDELIELLHYEPLAERVHERPVIIVPPQINKFYVLDLAPGRSLVEAALTSGQQVFMVSWRNPGPEQGDWSLDTYVTSLLAATDVAREITSQPDVNLLGVCAGGITSAALLGYLAAIGDKRINAVTFLVTALDWEVPSTVSTFVSGRSVSSAMQRSRRKGVLEGRELASVFAWLRPNDLVWNYWVNNYLLGRNPPAFDILAWNADATNLPAGLHADFLTTAATNAMAQPGGVEVLGEKVDLGAVTCDAYVVGGLTDHIIPWQSCYSSLDLLGGSTEFVLCASGHIQTLVCPLDSPKARYLTGNDRPADPEAWRAGAEEHSGSWWDHWLTWLGERGGELVAAPAGVGSAAYPAGDAAPGSYVHG